MKRRDFIKNTIPIASAPLIVGGMPINALAETPSLKKLVNGYEESDRALVLIFLDGGNDGINTIMPLDQYDVLMRDGSGGSSKPLRRPDLMISENKFLKINDSMGFHPKMGDFKNLYDENKMTFVRNVGYPNPNKSHFRSTDIWNAGSAADEYITSGWLGRYLSSDHPEYPDNYPNSDYTDPLALTIGRVTSNTCQGPMINMGIAVKNFNNFIDIKEGDGVVPDTPYGHELEYIRKASKLTNDYLERVELAANSSSNSNVTYPEYDLAEQLQTIAKLIDGGLKTKIYIARIGGFDTHDSQVENGNAEEGRHSTLLKILSESVAAFQSDIINRGLENRILTMTYSEFGRRVFQNKSYGTDHGEGAPMFFVSPFVNPDYIGSMPSLEFIDNIEWEHDFRSVYGSVLMDWFGVEENIIKALLYENFEYVPILIGAKTTTGIDNENNTNNKLNVYPNPVKKWINIEFEVKSGDVELNIIDTNGRVVDELISKSLKSGKHSIKSNLEKLKNGLYFVRFINQKSKYSRSIIKQH